MKDGEQGEGEEEEGETGEGGGELVVHDGAGGPVAVKVLTRELLLEAKNASDGLSVNLGRFHYY